jgi:putative transposase
MLEKDTNTTDKYTPVGDGYTQMANTDISRIQVQKAYKFRIYPNKTQQHDLWRIIGACRWIYNHFLDESKAYYLEHQKTIPYKEMSASMTKLRKEVDWLTEVQHQPLQQSIRGLDTAYSKFFRKEARFPRFKSRKDSRQSFRKVIRWNMKDKSLSIQSDIRVRTQGKLPPTDSHLGTLCISATKTGKWYASITALEYVDLPVIASAPIGIDLGLTHTAITSDGQKFDNLTLAKRQTKRLKYLQQSLSRKQKGSHRREKAKLELTRLHEKIANRRMNHLHQISSAITSKNHALIAVEDLAVVNMLKNHRLARSISDVSWGELVRQLGYKQQWRGGQFVKIHRFFPSSKTCSECHFVLDKLPLSVREWECPRCYTRHDRDINAAKMILKQAGEQLGVEGTDGIGSNTERVTGLLKRGYAGVTSE